MATILSSFLAAGLLPIGEDDEKLKLLESAAGELAKQLSATPLLAYRLALLGFDNRVAASDPIVAKVEGVVLSKWNTIINKTGAGPVQVYRAVALRALEAAAEKKATLKQASGLIALNEPEFHSDGKERDVITAMLGQFESTVSTESTEAWVSTAGMAFPKLSAKVKKVHLSKDELSTAIAGAVGPHDEDGNALNTPNPHWPNVGEPWAHEFVGRATDAIYSAVQKASRDFVDEIESAMRDSIQALVAGVERLAVRDAKSELLWIRMSSYSPSARRSFSELKDASLLLHAAIDVSRAVARSAPRSVEFFLRDMVATITTKKVRLSDGLKEIGPILAGQPETQLFTDDPVEASGRRSWLDVAARNDATTSFEQQTGVSSTYQENAGELAVKFYRELQARRLLSGPE